MIDGVGENGGAVPFRGDGRVPSSEGTILPPTASLPEARLPRCVDEIEEALVEAHALERREPGGGRWPFAGDGPWHLIRGEAGDYGGDGQDGASSSRAPRPPLDAAEVARLAELRRWLQLIPHESDRKLVWIATARLHAGEGRVPWKAVARWMRIDRSPDALALRYRKALAGVVCVLNGWPSRRARAMAA